MKKTTTPKQFEVLVDFLKKHSDLAVGFATSSEAKVKRRQMWIRLTDKLNDHGPPVRNCMEWKSIWSDYKYNLKRKLAADLKLARRKNWSKRLAFNHIEQTVIGLLGFKDKHVEFNKYNRKSAYSFPEVTQDSDVLEENSPLSSELDPIGSDTEMDANNEGVMTNDDFDTKIEVAVINNSVEPSHSAEEEYIEEPTDCGVNASPNLDDILMSMQKTQQAILKELKESNRHKRNTNHRNERLLQLELDKFEEEKRQNSEKNKQVYINIELKRKELELYELKLKGHCTQCAVKREID